MAGYTFATILVSPLKRALETCRLAGYGDQMQSKDDLKEWDYGKYEGLTTAQIHSTRPHWDLWRDGCPAGETADDVGRRVDRVITEIRATSGDTAVFAHGHLLRVLAARWLDLHASKGRLFALDTAGVSLLGAEHRQPAILNWNLQPPAGASTVIR